MPMIGQLPSLVAINPADEIPVSHDGLTQSISVGMLLSGTQPAILAPTGTLLGRESLGPGGPEPINVGVGLGLQASVLVATGADHSAFVNQTVLQPTDQAVLNSGGSPKLLELSLLRGLFSAGSNIAIDSAGTISAAVSATSSDADDTSYSVADLPLVTTISADDLVGISQNGVADSITYRNFLNGLTINEAQPAVAASNSDTTWVAQSGGTMVCQTFSAIWAWIVSNQPSYKCPVVEIATNTTLDGTVHNGRILVCSQPVTLTPVFTNMGAGFMCSVINLCNGAVTFGAGIVSSSGESALPAGLSCRMQGVTYSGGSVVYASLSGSAAQNVSIPGTVTGLNITGVSSNLVSLAWVTPMSGGTVTSYTVQYQTIGATTWATASSAVIGMSYSIFGLQPSTVYNFAVFASNPVGSGPSSSVVTGSTAPAAGVVPSQITGLIASMPTSAGLALTWSAPFIGTPPINYAVNYRVTGTTNWTTYPSGVTGTSANLIGLSASTSYDCEVFASNAFGASIPSVVVTQSTLAAETSVTSVIWNLTPSGSYTHGNGSIGVNAQITPSSAAVQFAFGTSPTVPPVSWTVANYVNSDLWGAYLNVPATPGTWYVWVEGVDGSLPTVETTSFSVT